MNLTQRIYCAVGTAIASGILIALLAGHFNYSTATEYDRILTQEVQQSQLARELQLTFKKQVQEWKDILLRGSNPAELDKYVAKFHAEQSRVQALAGQLNAATEGDPDVHGLMEDFQHSTQQLNQRYELALKSFVASKGIDFAAADSQVKGIDRQPTEELDTLVQHLSQQAHQSVADEHNRMTGRGHLLLLILLVSSCASVLLGIYAVRTFRIGIHTVTDQLQEIANGDGDLTSRIPIHRRDEIGVLCEQFNQFIEKLQGLMLEVSHASGKLANISTEASSLSTQSESNSCSQAAKTQQITLSMEEIAEKAQEISDHALQVANASRQSADAAIECGKAVETSLETIQEIVASAETVTTHISQLGNRSTEVGKIASVIGEIAGQTNLLALNAAIEAARAGEQGRGFAVVAGEVRRLAERTSQATEEIAATVQAIQRETQQAIEATHQAREHTKKGMEQTTAAVSSLRDMIELAKRSGEMIHQIAVASGAQSSTTEGVRSKIFEISEITQHTLSAAQQSSTSTREISNLAMSMDALVQQFQLEHATQ